MSTGLCKTLAEQTERVFKHTRAGSFETRRRYKQAFLRFCVYLAEIWHLQKLKNISAKHVYGYFEHLKAKGLDTSTLKTEASAIRFVADMIPDFREHLPTNDQLELERRSYGQDDKTWSPGEVERMCGLACDLGYTDYAVAIQLGYHLALRIHEVYRLDRANAEDAIRTGILEVKGKGGLHRWIPLCDGARDAILERMSAVPRGAKLFVPNEATAKQAQMALQHFIERYRDKISDNDPDREELVFHGLRHSRACIWYTELIHKGVPVETALLDISRLMGHNRTSITRIYLATVMKDGDTNV